MWSVLGILVFILVIILIVQFTSAPSASSLAMAPQVTAGIFDPSNATQLQLNNTLHKLMAEHVGYTYTVVNAFFHNPAALTPTLNRLLQNQTQLGNAIKPVFGDAAGNELSRLLHEHINGYVPLLEAVRDGDMQKGDQAFEAILSNGRQIGRFLENANPTYWPSPSVQELFTEHNMQTRQYALDLAQGNYEQATRHYDAAFDHMQRMAEALARGIVGYQTMLK